MFWFGPAYRGALANSLIGFILCLSIVAVTGYVGQISLAPLAFAGVSAFAVAELSTGRGWPFPLPILAGAAVAALVGVLVAIPALRIRGVNLAIVTLAFAVVADRFLFANPTVNGGLDRAFVDTPTLLQPNRTVTYTILGVFTGGDGLRPSPMTSIFLLVVATGLAYGVANFRRSATGRQLLAVRNNERAAAAAGVDVARIKAVAFALSAAVAGVGGAVIAYRAGEASAGRFTLNLALLTFAVAYLGGISRISGAVLGGLFVTGGLGFTFLIDQVGLPENLLVAAAGLGLVISPIVNPDGVADSLERLARRVGVAR
jgi:branched-chain amino acid transport system permease protein